MDVEQLAKRLEGYSRWATMDSEFEATETLAGEAATALRTLHSENARLAAEVERLRDYFFQSRGMEKAPCLICGYNGPNYYQPSVHPCAAKHHAALEGKS